MTDRFDVVVIGGGPAGYVAAIRSAQLGRRVACVDDWRDSAARPVLGGTCLNVGCIPSKALLESSELYASALTHLPAMGIQLSGATLDLPAMMAHKDRVVTDLTSGVAALFRAHDIAWIPGRGRLLSQRQVEVTGHDGKKRTLDAESVVLASGSSPVDISAAPLASPYIVDSTGALAFERVPERLGIIGAGVIGLELGSVWRRLGAEVVLLEAQERFLSMADGQVAREALKQFKNQGLDIRLGARVRSCAVAAGRVNVEYQDAGGDQKLPVDRLIVAVGRRPNTGGLYAEEARLLLDEWGFVLVDEQCRTSLPGVYAIGDLVRGPMLAHKGMEEGVMVAELIAGHSARVSYDAVPSVIYTAPEIAWAGKSEERLKADAVAYTVGSFPFAANGRARAMGATTGFIKILADAQTDRVLGVHMIGPQCAELIALGVMALEFGASSEDLALTIFAHPTVSEVFHEAALAVRGQPIHVARPTKRPARTG